MNTTLPPRADQGAAHTQTARVPEEPRSGLAPETKTPRPRLAAVFDAFEGDSDDALEFYVALADELGAHTVVDVGCGTGHLAVRLAATGRSVTAVDPAAVALRVALANQRAESATRIHANATALPAVAADLAVITGDVAQAILADNEWAQTLRARRARTAAGGPSGSRDHTPHTARLVGPCAPVGRTAHRRPARPRTGAAASGGDRSGVAVHLVTAQLPLRVRRRGVDLRLDPAAPQPRRSGGRPSGPRLPGARRP
ncbi:class I SAM-dependent methyltransferase [Actinospica sp. MGRD01-02]|uniref:Class I SAM-dependent methyltransferase n=1 Tax=Actinospica acidithermotolerans TaxID=2828514 RepID=A0A941EH97_9ACTN|nr:methyltransferase domain-containing protein [Actinospica acidithermotolerans]MBR7830753.1 class I SAM-dependent methyltransferase [Actinospica acidithermotolerans]